MKEIKLASFTVDVHDCKGRDCNFCEQFGVWEQGEEVGKSIDRLFK